jgi:hypothetical protein
LAFDRPAGPSTSLIEQGRYITLFARGMPLDGAQNGRFDTPA